MTYENSGAQPPYAPNSYGGPMADPARGADLTWAVEGAEIQRAANVKHADDDDFGQPGTLYRETMDDAGRAALLEAIVGHAGAPEVTDAVKARVPAYWGSVDAGARREGRRRSGHRARRASARRRSPRWQVARNLDPLPRDSVSARHLRGTPLHTCRSTRGGSPLYPYRRPSAGPEVSSEEKRMRFRSVTAACTAVVALALGAGVAQAASPADYAQIARNIIPSGQPGGFPFPTGASTQAQMYNALTPLGGKVTTADLFSDFKSEAFGLGTDGPGTTEPVSYPGVTIIRDRFDVPHVTATTHGGGVWAAGWITAEDRGLLLQQARYDSLVAAIDAPGLSAIGLVEHLKNFVPSQQTVNVVSRQTQVLLNAGSEGHAVLHDIDTYITGINAYLTASHSTEAPFTRTDIYAFNALKDQFFGEGGGDEANRSMFLGALERRLGVKKGYSVFNDLRQNLNAGSPTTVDGTFNYEHAPTKPGAPGSVVLNPGSFKSTPAAPAAVTAKVPGLEPRPHASNELMVEGRYSTTGHPLLVGGPQVGYFYPGLTLEIDMHAPGLDWRGATSAPFPGYMLIGRGPDFATTLTSAAADDTDQFAETLCGHSTTRYIYKGKCLTMHRFTPARSAVPRSPSTPRSTVPSSAMRWSAGTRWRSRASAPATARTCSISCSTAVCPTARCTARSRSSRRRH